MIFKITLSTFLFANLTLVVIDEVLDRSDKEYHTEQQLTMLLREDHFCNGSFDQRVESGQVERIVQRMIKLLEK